MQDDSEEGVAGLTEGQIACLRLVDGHHTSKEIARILGISPFTVDQRLDAARKKLGASSRKDAARIFARMEASGIYEPLVYHPAALADRPDRDSRSPSPGAGQGLQFFGIPPFGGRRHHLSKGQVLVQAMNVAFLSALAVAVLALVITGSMRLLG